MVTVAEIILNRKSGCTASRFGRPLGSSDSSVVANPFLFIDRCSSVIARCADWQAIETRTNGTANSNVTSQMVWSAAYVNAAVLQDTYSGGVIQPNGRLYFLQDANWNTTAIVGLVSGNWQVTRRYAYSPYGTITVLNADWSTPPAGTQPVVQNLYQGMQLDAVTGLYYARNRNYSPSLGRWISQDPAGYINGANTYQFVMSNPVGNVDPSGLGTPYGGMSQAQFDQIHSPPFTPTNWGQVGLGSLNVAVGYGQMAKGLPIWDTPPGLMLLTNGDLMANAGVHQIWNGFGGNWQNPVPGSLLQATGTPPAVQHTVDTVTGLNPANALDAVEEGVNAAKLLHDLENFLQQARNLLQPQPASCKDPPDAMLGQDV